MAFVQSKLRRIDPAPIPKEARFRCSCHGLVPLEDLLRHSSGSIEGWNRREQIVGAQILALDHAATAHHVAVLGIPGRVEAAAYPGCFFDNRNCVPLNISVANKESGGSKRSDAAAYKICSRTVILRPFHGNCLTLSFCLAFAASAQTSSTCPGYWRTVRLSNCCAEETVFN